MAEEADAKECAHGVCNCPAAEGEDYCGPYCEDAKTRTEMVQLCDCGHPTCVG
jgi:hypothetical protein